MKYVLRPTQNDVIHYAKGSESKNHKYITRKMNDGKWRYTYKEKRKGVVAPATKLSSTFKATNDLINDLEGVITTKSAASELVDRGTNPNGSSYDNLKVALMEIGIDPSNFSDAEIEDIRQSVRDYYNKTIKNSVTNADGSAYSPTNVTRKAVTNADGGNYTPTNTKRKAVTNASGTSYSPSDTVKRSQAKADKADMERVGNDIMRQLSKDSIGGGSHSFGTKDDPDVVATRKGIELVNDLIDTYKETQERKAIEKEERKKRYNKNNLTREFTKSLRGGGVHNF